MAQLPESNGDEGVSMIEVMLAVAVMSVTTLGLIAAQLWAERQVLAIGYRGDAMWIADALAESARAPQSADGAVVRWQARAAERLPGGEASIESAGSGGLPAARVTWSAPLDSTFEWHAAPEACGTQTVSKERACATLAFVR